MPQDLMQPFKAYLQHQLKGKLFSEVTVGECAAMPEPVKQGYEAEYWRRVTGEDFEKIDEDNRKDAAEETENQFLGSGLPV